MLTEVVNRPANFAGSWTSAHLSATGRGVVASPAMDPRVVASPDGAHLAVLRDHRLSLFALDTGRRVAVAEVVGTELAFAGPHVVVHGRDAHTSVVTVLSMPGLAVTSSHELTAPTRLMAATLGYVLLDRGDQAMMIQCGRPAAVTPLRPPAAFAHAVGLEAPQFITFGGRGAELWDAASRRPEARLRLELPPDTVEVGLTNRHAMLWAATSQPCLHLARISDGRVSTLWLDATPRNLRSHPVAAWVVADVGGRAMALNLAIGDIVPLDVSSGPIVAVAPRRDRDTGAVVVMLEGDALELRLLGGEARPMPRRDGEDGGEGAADVVEVTVPAGAATTGQGSGGAAETTAGGGRPSSLRERLGQRPPASERVIAPPTALAAPAPSTPATSTSPGDAAPRRPALSLADRLGARTSVKSIGGELTVAGAEPATASVEHGTERVVEPAHSLASAPSPAVAPPLAVLVVEETLAHVAPSAPVAPPMAPLREPVERARPARAGGWRDLLVAWTRAGCVGEPPALDGSPLRVLHVRLGLATLAWPMLCALYGRWLRGGGGHGLATARLAALGGEPSPASWSEALGGGGLGGLGLIVWRHGRACLADAVGDHLDERLPGIAELIGPGRRRSPSPGTSTLVGDGPSAARGHAARLADEFGQVALLARAPTAAELAEARLEAWLRGLALVVLGDPGPLALRADEAVIAVVPLIP